MKKKSSFLKVLAAILVIAVAAAMVLVPFILDRAQSETENTASILSGAAETGTIVKTLSGTGTITDSDSVKIEIPSGVELTEYLVETGDYVTAGSPVATVNRTSVMQTVSALQESIEYLEEEMTDALSSDTSTTITATAGGRVISLYAQAGDSVSEVMESNGCLAVLSIDGYFAADFEADASLKAGSAVTVALADGSTSDGKIEKNINGAATVIFDDSFGTPGDTVTVYASDGEKAGEGTVYIHSEWHATAYTGSIKKVNTQVGKKLSEGAAIFTLTGADGNADYNILTSEHREYEEVMLQLFTLYQEGVVTAGTDGCVSGIDDSLVNVSSSGDGKAKIVLLASNAPTGGEANYTDRYGVITGVNDDGTVSVLFLSSGAVSDYGQLGSYGSVTVTLPSGGIYTGSSGASGQGSSGGEGQSGQPSAENPGASSGETPQGGEGNEPGSGVTWQQKSGVAVGEIYVFSYDGDTLVWMIYAGSDSAIASGSSGTGAGSGDSGGGGGMSGGFYGGGYTVTETEPELYEISPVTIMSVTPQEQVTITITVDELDILSVTQGQEVTVTIDALPGRSFTGYVTAINTVGSNSGGSTKFTAEVTMERTANIIAGMNASCSIITDEVKDAVIIPVEALVDIGTKTVVYTGYDEENEVLTDPVEVQTGASDGIQVQILSGLSEGDGYWYEYYDTLAINTELSALKINPQ